jgi:hypothetical protein
MGIIGNLDDIVEEVLANHPELKGDTGEKGDTGATGATGATGVAGQDGVTWYSGDGTVSINEIGKENDLYLDTSNGDVLKKIEGVYTFQLNITAGLSASGVKSLYESNDDTNAYTDDEKDKVGHIAVTESIDLDDISDKVQRTEEIHTDTNEPTGFVREFRETTGVMELCVCAGITGYNNPDLGYTNHDFVNSMVIRIDHNGIATIHDTTTFYDGTAVAERTFRIMPLAYSGTVDIINEETGALENRADIRDTSINSGEYYSIYVEGIKTNITSGQSVQFPNESGLQFVYHTDNGTLALAQTFSFNYFEDRPITATVYGNAVDFQLVNFGDERHGIQMDGFTHRRLHFIEGTAYVEGMAINGLTSGGTTYTNIGSGKAYDEDIYILANAQTVAPHFYLQYDATEAKNIWRVENDATDIALFDTGVAQWNEDVGGQYQLSNVTGNDCMIVFFVLTNNREFPYVKMLGQEVYDNALDARQGVSTAINNLITSGLPSPEFLPIGAIIVNASGELQLLSDGSEYLDLRTAKISGNGTTSVPVSSHNDLTNRDSANAHPSSAISYDGTTVEAKLNELLTVSEW